MRCATQPSPAFSTASSRPSRRTARTVVKVGKGTSPAEAAREATRTSRPRPASRKAQNQYVELEQERADKIFVILAEFGNQRHPDFPDVDTDPDTPGPTTFEGPLRNKIPEPDRTKDNSTVWQADYNRQHYQDLYFKNSKGAESVKTYYETQSSGRYTVDGVVSDWVKVPYNEARYGREDATTWNLIEDAVTAWIEQQHAAGKTDAQIKTAMAEYDQWDRYDYNGNGNFNEPDGYIDHFQIVHAGGDEADGDPQQGEDAIWSHRWNAFLTDAGITGPSYNRLGGTQVGDTGIWISDYTVQPENGGLSVFVHEYGHDLGLPDAYGSAGRQLQRVLDADGAEPTQRQGRAARHPPGRPRCVGEAAARLARLRGDRAPSRRRRSSSVRRSTTPRRHRVLSSCCPRRT